MSFLRVVLHKTLFFEFWFVAMATKFGLFLQKFQFASSFFVFRWNRAIFQTLVFREPLYKTLFFDFGFRPPNPQNWLPKISTKIAYNSACMALRPEMFAPNRGFSGMADWMEPYKMLPADPCCHGNEIWAKIAYNSTCTADRPQMFGPYREFFENGRFNAIMQNLVRQTLVAMTTTFVLGAESNRLPACMYVCLLTPRLA